VNCQNSHLYIGDQANCAILLAYQETLWMLTGDRDIVVHEKDACVLVRFSASLAME